MGWSVRTLGFMRWVLLLLVACVAIGCESSGRFEVMVRNQTDLPLSVGFVKNGPPVDLAWASPTEMLLTRPKERNRRWGTVIPAGETGVIGPQQGKFKTGVTAFVAIYVGDKTTLDLTAVSSDSPDQLWIPIPNGRSAFEIHNDQGQLVAQPLRRP